MMRCMRSLLLVGLILALPGCTELKTGDVSLDGWTLEIFADPIRRTYLPGERLQAFAEVRTGDRALITDPYLEWETVGAEDEGEGYFRLSNEEAVAVLKCCMIMGEARVCGEKEFPVDRSPPVLTVETPRAGDQLLISEDDTIRVSGTIVDTNLEARLAVYLNGRALPIDENGRFDEEIDSEFGIHHLLFEGTDGFHEPVRRRFDVLVADAYLPPIEGTTNFVLEDTVVLRLGQEFFDRLLGGTHLDPHERPLLAKDLASILELLIINLDLASLLGDLANFDFGDVLTFGVTSISVDDAVVDFEIIEGEGLNLKLNINDVFIGTTGSLTLAIGNAEPRVFNLGGGISTDLRAEISLDVTVDPAGKISSSFTIDHVGIASFHPMFEDDLGEFMNTILSLGTLSTSLRGFIDSEIIEGPLLGEFLDVIPETIDDILNMLGSILDGVQFTIPLEQLGNPPMTIEFGSRIGALTFTQHPTEGSLDASLIMEVGTPHEPIQEHSLGLPQAKADPIPPFSGVGGVQLAIRQDFINGVLHSLWNAGLMNGQLSTADLSDDIPLDVDVVLNPRLPPVIRMAPYNTSCRVDGERCDAIVQIGQLEINASVIRLTANFEAGARVAIRDGEVSLNVGDEPVITIWSPSSGMTDGIAEMVREAVADSLWPMIRDLLGEEGLAIPLPIPSPEELGLGEIAPALANSSIAIRTFGRVDVATGYLGLAADVEIEVP